jgi:tight adherence protein C
MDIVMRLFSVEMTDSKTLRMLLIALVAASAFLCILIVLRFLATWQDPVRRRLYRVVDDPNKSRRTLSAKMLRVLEAADPYITPQNTKERGNAQSRWLRAGYRNPQALKIYYGLKTMLMLGLPALVSLLVPLLNTLAINGSRLALLSEAAMKHVGWIALVAAAIGMVLPSYVLDKKIANRQKQIINAFPDALDLLVICSEAGLGLSSAFIRVANELEDGYPLLAEELSIVNAEVLAGVDRVQALHGLAQRTGLDDIRGLVALLAQSIVLGSSIADALRIYSEEFRDKRMQRAEEMAAKLGTKMIFPMVFCFFPGFFVVALGPAFLKLAEVFSKH